MRWKNGKFTDGVTTVYSAEKVLMNKNTVTLSEEDEKTARFLLNRKRQSYAKDCEHFIINQFFFHLFIKSLARSASMIIFAEVAIIFSVQLIIFFTKPAHN